MASIQEQPLMARVRYLASVWKVVDIDQVLNSLIVTPRKFAVPNSRNSLIRDLESCSFSLNSRILLMTFRGQVNFILN